MKRLITTILSLIICSTAIADTSFEDLFDIHAGNASTTANRVTSFHADNINLSFTEKLNELNALSQNIDSHIKASPDNPVLWFIKGLNYSNLAAIYSAHNNRQQADFFVSRKNGAYKKTIDIDKSQHVLTAAIYATMKHGLPEDLKITAIQKELELGGNGENESYYWYLHWSNINALEKAGRSQEAQQALKTMKSEMLEQGVASNDFHQLTREIEQQIGQPAQTKRLPNATTRKSRQTSHSTVTVSDLTWILIVIAIIALILAWKYELLIFKKKR